MEVEESQERIDHAKAQRYKSMVPTSRKMPEVYSQD